MRPLVLLVLLLSGCADVSEIRDPDGGIRYLVGCYGALTPMSVCHDKAKELCPGGYEVDDSREFMGPGLVTEAGTARDLERQLVIQCTGPGGETAPVKGS